MSNSNQARHGKPFTVGNITNNSGQVVGYKVSRASLGGGQKAASFSIASPSAASLALCQDECDRLNVESGLPIQPRRKHAATPVLFKGRWIDPVDGGWAVRISRSLHGQTRATFAEARLDVGR